MGNRATFALTAVVIALISLSMSALAAPAVSNVQAAQRPGSNLVDITYSVSGETAAWVSVQVSSDGGRMFSLPANSLTGDVGANVTVGNSRRIVWSAGADWPNQFSSNMKVMVQAMSALLDTAANPAYGAAPNWVNGSGVVSGFTSWVHAVFGSGSAGFVRRSSTYGSGGAGNVDSSGLAFGLFAEAVGTTATATRWFSHGPLQVGDSFTIQIGLNYRNGKKGFNLTGAGQTIFTFIAGNTDADPSDEYSVFDAASGNGDLGIPYASQSPFTLSFVQITDNGGTWTISRSGASPASPITGTYTGRPDGLKMFIQDTEPGPPNSLYCNNLKLIRTVPPSHPVGMALIPSGSFAMGNQMDPSEGEPYELPVHTVNVSAFYMDKYEVSKAQWDEVASWAAANGYDISPPTAFGKAANYPVKGVPWYQVVKWCNARSQKENLTPCYTVGGVVMKTGTSMPDCNFSANGYRLPTEAEWEKAARGGLSGKRFPWGDTISHSQANYYVWSPFGTTNGYSYDVSPTSGNHPSYLTGGAPYSSPVGSFAANGYGLYDMTGNVWEWCNDWYSETYYATSPAVDPRGPASGAYMLRVVRGGSWGLSAPNQRTAFRLMRPAHNSFEIGGIGFRCVRSSVP